MEGEAKLVYGKELKEEAEMYGKEVKEEVQMYGKEVVEIYRKEVFLTQAPSLY